VLGLRVECRALVVPRAIHGARAVGERKRTRQDRDDRAPAGELQRVTSGYPLIGGRLDYVAGRPVAVLVYGRRQHVINVWLWPVGTGSSAGPAMRTERGYHLLHWTGAGFTTWVVSDLGVSELGQFAALLRQADGYVPGQVAPR
jgi:anti-sigma factor RsiW